MSFMERFLKMLCTKRPRSRLTAYTRLLSTFNISIWGMMRSIKNEWKSLSFLHCHKQESLSVKVLLASILLSSRVIRLVRTRLYSNVKLRSCTQQPCIHGRVSAPEILYYPRNSIPNSIIECATEKENPLLALD